MDEEFGMEKLEEERSGEWRYMKDADMGETDEETRNLRRCTTTRRSRPRRSTGSIKGKERHWLLRQAALRAADGRPGAKRK